MNKLKEIFENLKNDLMVFLLISILIGLGLFLILQPKTYFTEQGVIVDKVYSPAATSLQPIYTCDTKGECTTTLITQYHSESFSVLVRVNDNTQSYSVSSNFYGNHSINDSVSIVCWQGKLVKTTLCDIQE